MKAIQVTRRGGPEVFQLADIPVPEPKPGQIRLRMAAAALNYSDIQIAGAFYPGLTDPGKLPYIAGREGAGTVDALGEGVTNVEIGDRVMALGIDGAFGEYALCPAQVAQKIPDSVSFTAASGFLLSHLAAVAAVEVCADLKPGQTFLVHAAASSVGQNAVKLAKSIGANVIATASNEDKLNTAKACGADHVINYVESDFRPAVLDITGGQGVDVALDTVGGEVLQRTMEVIRPFGKLIIAGNASNSPVMFSHYELLQKYRFSLVTMELGTMMVKRRDLMQRVFGRMLELMEQGLFPFEEPTCFALEEAQQALSQMANRKITGAASLVMPH